MSAPTNPPIPRQPIGATFVVAICLLGLFAILQLAFVAWYYLPLLSQQIKASAANRNTVTEAAPAAQAAAPLPTVAPVPPAQPSGQPNMQAMQRASQLLAEADKSARVGEYEEALKYLDQVEAVLPGDPAALLRRAQILERMDQTGDAVLALEGALKYPALPDDVRSQVERKLDQLSRYMASTGQTVTRPDEATGAEDHGASVRDEVGLQPGATLGIVDVRVKDSDKPGIKKFQVAVKARPGSKIDITQMQVAVYFYDKTEEGDVLPTESKVNYQWMSPPVDWADDMPEILEITDILPDSELPGSAASNGSPGRKYEGYIVGVYYNKELQDFRSDPANLQKKFPLPLYLPSVKDSAQ